MNLPTDQLHHWCSQSHLEVNLFKPVEMTVDFLRLHIYFVQFLKALYMYG